MTLVSVIIPTRNRAHLVNRAVQSVLSQSYPHVECIVVDDGSTDDTPAVLQGWGDAILTVYQAHQGVAAARNRGGACAKGRLIAFLDSDDEWLPSKLERQLELFCGTCHHFICHTDELWLRDNQPVPQKKKHRKQGGRFFERALKRCLISPSSVVLSRGLLDETGWFDETLPAAEDYDLWLRITAYYAVDFVPEALVIKHGGHADQLSRTVPAIDRYRVRAIQRILTHRELPPDYRDAAIRELIKKCGILAAGSAKRGNRKEAAYYRDIARQFAHTGHSPIPT